MIVVGLETEKCFQGKRAQSVVVLILYQPVEDERWKEICHKHHREHADDSDLSQRMEGGVLGKDECTDADEHDDS